MYVFTMKPNTLTAAIAWQRSHSKSANTTKASGRMSVINMETSAQTLKVTTVSRAGFLPYLLAMELKSPYAANAEGAVIS